MKKKQLIGMFFLMVCLFVAVSSVYSAYFNGTCYDCGSVSNCEDGNGLPDSGYDSCTVVYWTNGQPSRCILGNWGC